MYRSSRFPVVKPPVGSAIDPNWWGWKRGIKLAYALNEGGGTLIHRLTPFAGSVNGSILNPSSHISWAQSVGGRPGPHLSFDGAGSTTNHLNIDSSATFWVTGSGVGIAFTVCAWVWCNGFSNQLYPTIIQLRDDDGLSWFLKFSNQSTFNGIAWGNGDTTPNIGYGNFHSNTTAKTNQWVHVALVASGTNGAAAATYTCYENGISIGSVTAGAFAQVVAESDIGSILSSGSYYLWDGYIEQVQFFTQALTATEVWRMYSEPWHWIQPIEKRISYGLPTLPIYIDEEPQIILPQWQWN